MVTKKVAGRVREHPPAAEIPRNWSEPRALVRESTTIRTASASDSGSNRSQRAAHYLPSILYLAAFAALVVAFVELTPPTHSVHATIAIAAAGVLWITGEATS